MNAKAFGRVLKNTLIMDLEYRFNYVMLVLASLITLVMEWAIFSNVFKDRDVVSGLAASSAFGFILYGLLIRTIQNMWGPIFASIEEVKDGSFRRYIIQPVFHPSYFVAQAIGNKLTPTIAAVVICVFYKFGPFDAPESILALSDLPYTILSFALSTLLLWIAYLLIVYASFFLDESTFLVVSLNIALSLLSGSQLPLSWYPPLVQKIIGLTPLPLWGDWPLRAGLGMLSDAEKIQYLGSWCAWSLALGVLVCFFYKGGLKRYESFGG